MKIDFHDMYAVVSVYFLFKKENCYGQVICSIAEKQTAIFLIKFKHRCMMNLQTILNCFGSQKTIQK